MKTSDNRTSFRCLQLSYLLITFFIVSSCGTIRELREFPAVIHANREAIESSTEKLHRIGVAVADNTAGIVTNQRAVGASSVAVSNNIVEVNRITHDIRANAAIVDRSSIVISNNANTVELSTAKIRENSIAIEASTLGVNLNKEAVLKSTAAINENKAVVERSTEALAKIADLLKEIANMESHRPLLVTLGVLASACFCAPFVLSVITLLQCLKALRLQGLQKVSPSSRLESVGEIAVHKTVYKGGDLSTP